MATFDPIRSLAKLGARTLRNRDARKRAQRHRHMATEAYERLRESTDRPELDAATSREIREYSSKVLGSANFQHWLRLYALYQGRFVEGWIPEDVYGQRVLPHLNARRGPVRSPRTLARRIFDTDVFPDLAYLVNGTWFTPDYEPISPEQLLDHVFADHEEVYLKRDGSGTGRGISRLASSEFEESTRRLTGNHVVQRAIVPHSWFTSIDSTAVPTLRVTTTYLDSEGPRFRAAFLRVGYASQGFVNPSQLLRCAVVDEQGALAPEALDETWTSHSRHPDSGFVFAAASVPHFGAARDICVKLHARLPHAPIIGWDLAINPGGHVEMMEWNSGYPDIKFTEAAPCPSFADCGFERFAEHRMAGREA